MKSGDRIITTGRMTGRTIRLMVACFPVVAVSACDSSSREGPPPMQIVLLESSHSPRVYLADWLGRRLKPRLLTEFPANMRVREVSTSSGESIIAVATSRRENGKEKSELHLIDPLTGRYEKAFEEGEGFSIYIIAIAPKGQWIAFLSSAQAPSDRTPWGLLVKPKDIFLYNRTAQRVSPVMQGKVNWTLSWTPDGKQLTYDTVDGWIESVSLSTQRIERLVQGQLPAWSPDGKRLAYQRWDADGQRSAYFTYDPVRRISQEVYRMPGGIRFPFGDLYWSPDNRYLSFNVGYDLVGLASTRCAAVEVDTGKAFRLRSQEMYCGPWLAGQSAIESGTKKTPDTK